MPQTTPQNPLGDPKAFRGYSTRLKDLAKPEKKSDFLPPFERGVGSFALELVKIIVVAFAIIIPIRYFVLQPFYVKGASMEPNFHDNEYLIIDELSYRFHQPHRGDVVVLRNPSQLNEFFIKRVIGLPGERVVIANGQVSIFDQNGHGGLIDESAYLKSSVKTFGSVDLTLEKDQVYVMGDNRPASLDSRSFGPIPISDLVGRTAVRAWPVTKATVFATPSIPVNSSNQ